MSSTNGDIAYAVFTSSYTGAYGIDDMLVTAAVVPVPAAAWLFGTGIIGLVGVARRKR